MSIFKRSFPVRLWGERVVGEGGGGGGWDVTVSLISHSR